MKTEELVTLLALDVTPVDRFRHARPLFLALAIAMMTAIVPGLIVLGARADFTATAALVAFAERIAFGLAVLVPAYAFLVQLARPGGERRVRLSILIVPFIVMAMTALATLAQLPPSHWHNQIFGKGWLECLWFIPFNAIAPFAAVAWALRQAAPTNLTRAGAIAGLVAGTVSTLGYSFHCVDDAVSFTAVWYGATVGLCTYLGAKCGPIFLRW